MNIVLTGYSDGKKITAIKGIRAAVVETLSLKAAKDVADAVEQGTEVKLTIDPSKETELRECGVEFRRVIVDVPLADFVELLGRYPRDMAVGTVVDVLSVAALALDQDAFPRKDQS